MATSALRARVVLALVMMVAFYAFAVAAAAGLAWAGVSLGSALTHFRGRGLIAGGIAALALLAAGVVVLWSIVPRPQPFEAPGPELGRAKNPKLFREIERIAAWTGEAPPTHVYLMLDVNAFVTSRGGVMGLFGTRVMAIGLGLLGSLTVSQLRGVLAHEFGHFAGGDVKLLPWIVKARLAMLRTYENLSRAASGSTSSNELVIATMIFAVVQAPFAGLAKLYLRFTQSLSRAQEIAADRLAISLVGGEVHASALTDVERAGLVHRAFVTHEVGPLLGSGKVPPLAAGFSQFLASPRVVGALKNAPAAPAEADPYDSHPPLAERLAHARALAAKPQAGMLDEAAGVSLLGDLEACELALARFVTDSETLDRVSWENSGEHLVALWRRQYAAGGRPLWDLAVRDVPREAARARALLTAANIPNDHASDADVLGLLRGLLWVGLALMLVDAGFRVINAPGTDLRFERGEETVVLSDPLEHYFSDQGSSATWDARWQALGLLDATFLKPTTPQTVSG
jgi:heat shock protein HtpX